MHVTQLKNKIKYKIHINFNIRESLKYQKIKYNFHARATSKINCNTTVGARQSRKASQCVLILFITQQSDLKEFEEKTMYPHKREGYHVA